jgi:hypothetical protein
MVIKTMIRYQLKSVTVLSKMPKIHVDEDVEKWGRFVHYWWAYELV